MAGQTAKVVNISRLRVNDDGTGVRSVIFLYGCPLDCAWCCNPETRYGGRYYPMDAETLYAHIAGDLPYFLNGRGGLTFSGGEPLLHVDFLEDFIRCFCARFSVDIETSLYANTSAVRRLIPLIDEWFIDCKVFDAGRHLDYTGVSNRLILDNLAFLAGQIDPPRITITCPLIPGHNISREDLQAMAAYLKSLGIQKIQLHPYRKFQEDKHRQLGLEPIVIPDLTAEQYRSIADQLSAGGFLLDSRTPLREKDKCRYLKAIRMDLRDAHSIPVDIALCTFQGRCVGTCPRCEQELAIIKDYLEELP